MHLSTSGALRRLLPAAVAVGSLITASPALAGGPSATFTSSNVTSPASGNLVHDETSTDPAANQIDVAGTTSGGAAGESAQLYCISSGDTRYLGSAVLAADGSFSAEDLGTSGIRGQDCVLRAVPGSPPTVLTSFTGPRLRVASYQENEYGGTANAGRTYDFRAIAPQGAGRFYYDSLSACGIDYATPSIGGASPGYVDDSSPFSCGAYPWFQGDGTTPGLAVDDKPAYDAFGAYYRAQYGNVQERAGVPTPTFTKVFNPMDGSTVITESHDLVHCVDGDGDVTKSTNPYDDAACVGYVPANVRATRTITQGLDGARATFADSYAPTDGASHRLGVLYEYDQYTDNGSGYQLPGESGYSGHEEYDSFGPFASSTGTFLIASDPSYGEGSTGNAIGAVTYNPLPDGGAFYGNDGFYAGWSRTIAPGAPFKLTEVFDIGRKTPEVVARAAQANDAFTGPQVAITAPANGSTVDTATVQVSGTASDAQSAPSVTVNGVTAPMSGGQFSAPVTLTPGVNTITAVATDGAGGSAQAAIELTYVPKAAATPPGVTPPAVKQCTVPKISRGSTLKTTKSKIVKAGCKVGKVTSVKSKRVKKKGRVVSISRKGGSKVAIGTTIAIQVAKGTAVKRGGSRR